MLLIVGTIRLPADKVSDARPIMLSLLEASRAEDGCREYVYAEDLFDHGLIHVTEVWADQDALDRHFTSPHIAAWRATWPHLGVRDRHLRLYEVGEPRRI